MLLVGELGAKLSLYGKQQFDSDLSDSGGKFLGLGKVGSSVSSGIGASLRVAATGSTILAGAVAAVTASLFKTGVGYNTLQQTSRAALKTLLGGAEQANAQMDKLDDFATKSPFSKSVFITAQQQLLGFGMEAKKVIPTLDAIQQAVAATGGSSQQLSEITFVMAQIQAAGKITGQDLLQLGQRGINAADLIGSQMGKTGAQIKDEITNGSLSASDALDALTAGMAAKFAGASANVKQSFTGTVDRVKAASRDIGAALAEPFVSKNGGGLFVTWGNQVADVMRAVQAQTTPVVDILQGRALPVFAAITTTLDKARVVVKSWDSSQLNAQLDQLGKYAPAIAGLGAAWSVIGLQGVPVIGRLVAGINPLAAAILGVVAASPQLRASAGELFDSLRPLGPVIVNLAQVGMNMLNRILPVVAGGVIAVANVVTPLVSAIASIPTPVLAGVLAFLALNKGMQALTGGGAAVSNVFRSVGEQMAVQTKLAAMSGQQIGTFGSMAAVAGTKVSGLGLAIKTAFLSNPVGIALTVISAAVAVWASANADAAQRVEDHKTAVIDLRTSLNQTNGAITGATEASVLQGKAYTDIQDRLGKMSVGQKMWADAVIKGGTALGAVNGQLNSYADRQLKAAGAAASAETISKRLGLTYSEYMSVLLRSSDASEVLAAAHDKVGAAALRQQPVVQNLITGQLNAVSSTRDVATSLDEQRNALKQAIDEQSAAAKKAQEFAAAQDDAARSNSRLNEAILIARDTSKSATERLNALKQAIDELKGGAQNSQQATRDLNEQISTLGAAFAQTDDAGNKIAGTLVDASGAINTTTEAGRTLFDQVSGLNDKMLTAQQIAYDTAITNGKTIPEAYAAATAAAAPYQAALATAAAAAGLNDAQIAGMTATMLAIPAVSAYLITDNGTIDANKQQLLTLAQTILTTPGKAIDVSAPTIEPIKSQLEAMGFKITTLPNGMVHVDSNGIPDVETALTNLTNKTRVATIQVQYSQMGPKPVAKGGIFSHGIQTYAKGGMRSYASGGLPSGMYKERAGGIIKFAEETTNWEAFISGRSGEEARNRTILADAAKRLGMAVVPLATRQQSYAASPSLTTRSSAPSLSAAEAKRPIVLNIYPSEGMNESDLADLIATRIGRSL